MIDLTLTRAEVYRLQDSLNRTGEARYALCPRLEYRFLYSTGPSRLMYLQTFDGATVTLSTHPADLLGTHGGRDNPLTLTIRESE